MDPAKCKKTMDEIDEGKEIKVNSKNFLFLISYIERHRPEMRMIIQKLGAVVLIFKTMDPDENKKIKIDAD